MAKLYWWIFRHVLYIRLLNKINVSELDFPYETIVNLCPFGSKLAFNMGTPVPEQKISILGVEPNGNKFFAKYSEKRIAIALSRNEVKVLSKIRGSVEVPEVYEYQDNGNFFFFRTSYVEGVTFSSNKLNNGIVDLALEVNRLHLKDTNSGNLITGLSHGDFTPWNILRKDGSYQLIDWEFADERPLGYDLFTFIYKVNKWIGTNKDLYESVIGYDRLLRVYFSNWGIEDYMPYYHFFENNHHD